MGAFVNRSEVMVIRDETWEAWEEMTIGHASTSEKDTMRAQLLSIVGLEGLVNAEMAYTARWPVILAHTRAWTFTVNGKPPGSDNEALPINRNTVSELDPAYSEYAYSQIMQFAGPKLREETEAFFRGTRSGIRAESTTTE